MLDRSIQRGLRPVLDRLARMLAKRGVTADGLSGLGFALGLGAALAIVLGAFGTGLVLLLLSRLCDGLDGAVARATTPTDRGGFLDITLDFLFYAAIPLAFALHDPARNALPAALLLASFIGTGSSFLAFAVLAAKRGQSSLDMPDKSFYFLGGLTEATETIAVFVAMCLWPAHFPWLAMGFAALCLVTTVLRIRWGWQRFR